LGTSAGGGFPQWNCGCPPCAAARKPGSSVVHRLQSSVAVSGNGKKWFLVNASPDVTTQIERYLRVDQNTSIRSSPLEKIFITNADLDHSLGLLLLREGGRLRVTAPTGARDALCSGLRLDAVVGAFCGMDWTDATEIWRELGESGLQVRAVPLTATEPPRYAADAKGVHAVGYLFRDSHTKKQAAIFPDVAVLTDELLATFAECDALFFDGTFWRDDELKQLGISSRTAKDMGHMPISGESGSLARLAALKLKLCAYLHLNNTNPVLIPDSPERREVEAKGLVIAGDGMRVDL
jgi:pyrroloquinoline quinone biosynthesis protein B